MNAIQKLSHDLVAAERRRAEIAARLFRAGPARPGRRTDRQRDGEQARPQNPGRAV